MSGPVRIPSTVREGRQGVQLHVGSGRVRKIPFFGVEHSKIQTKQYALKISLEDTRMLCRHGVLAERGSEALELFRVVRSDEFIVLAARRVVHAGVRGPAVGTEKRTM